MYYWAFAHLSTRYDDTAENETKATADAKHVFGLDQQSERRSWFERCERGGSRAVNKVDAIQLAWDNADKKAQCASCIHIIESLYEDIWLANIISDSFSDAAHAIVGSAFSSFGKEVKQSLLACGSSIRMSKGCCNAKSCAIIALFIYKELYIANVEDCVAII